MNNAKKDYDTLLLELQIELVKMQKHIIEKKATSGTEALFL